MKPLTLWLGLIIFCLVGREGAAAPMSPPAGMGGAWEGIGQGDFRVFRLEVASGEGRSFVVMTAGQSQTVSMVFNVDRIDVRNRRVEVHATGADGPDDLHITGKIERLSNMVPSGMIDGKVSLVNGARVINTWRVAFVKNEGDYVSQLYRLAVDAAAKAQARKDYTSSVSRPTNRK